MLLLLPFVRAVYPGVEVAAVATSFCCFCIKVVVVGISFPLPLLLFKLATTKSNFLLRRQAEDNSLHFDALVHYVCEWSF